MATFASVTFVGANGANLNTLSGWTRIVNGNSGILVVDSNKIRSNHAQGVTYYRSEVSGSDGESVIGSIDVKSDAGNLGVGLRGTSSGTKTYLLVRLTGEWAIYRLDSAATLVKLAGLTLAVSTGIHQVKLTATNQGVGGADGVLLTAEIDGVAIGLSYKDVSANKLVTPGYLTVYADALRTSTTGIHLESLQGVDTTGSAATAITLTGPATGTTGAPSSIFTVGANGAITGTVVVTPSDGGAGGTFTPTTVSISSGSATGTFTYTAATDGAKTISVSNNGSLTNPSAITYTASALASGTVTSSVKDGRIFRHSGTTWALSNTGSIVESGTYANFTPNQIRLVQDGTNTAITGHDWATITTVAGGSYAHTFTDVPQGEGTGWYNTQVRDSAVPATIYASGKRGVGIHIGHYGQSQSSNQFENYPVVGSALTPSGMCRAHGGQGGMTVRNWAELDPTKASALIAAENILVPLLGGNIPVAFLNMGYPGTSLVRGGPNGNWLPTTGPIYQYGKTLIDGLEGSVDAIVDIRGESDANNGTVTQSEFYTALGTLYAQTRTDCGNANLPIIQVVLGATSSAYWADAAGEAVKKAQVQKAADAAIYRVESYDVALHADGLHRNTTGCEEVGRRWARAVASILGVATGYRSPRIAGVVQVSSTVYDVTLTHEVGSDFAPTSAITGLRVTDAGTPVTPNSIVRQAANKMRVTLASAPSALPMVAVAYGANPTSNFADNSSLALPMEYESGVAAIAVATSVSITFENRSGALRTNLTGLKWAFFDQVTPNLLAAPVAQGAVETTDASGVLVLGITGTSLTPGAIGWLVVSDSDGTTSQISNAFAGPVVVS